MPSGMPIMGFIINGFMPPMPPIMPMEALGFILAGGEVLRGLKQQQQLKESSLELCCCAGLATE